MKLRKYYFSKNMLYSLITTGVSLGLCLLLFFFEVAIFHKILIISMSVIMFSIGFGTFLKTLLANIKYWSTMIFHNHKYMIRTKGLNKKEIEKVKQWIENHPDPFLYVREKLSHYHKFVGKEIELPKFIYVTVQPYGTIKRVYMDQVVNGLYTGSDKCYISYHNDKSIMSSLLYHEIAHAVLYENKITYFNHEIMRKVGL